MRESKCLWALMIKYYDRYNVSIVPNGLIGNVDKTIAMVYEINYSTTRCVIETDGKNDEREKEFVYLECIYTRDGKCERGIERVNKKGKCS